MAAAAAAAETAAATTSHTATDAGSKQRYSVAAPVAVSEFSETSAQATGVAAAAAAVSEKAPVAEQAALEDLFGNVPVRITLHAATEKIRVNKQPVKEASMGLKLPSRLQTVQRQLEVCLCGSMTGRLSSAVATEAMAAATAATSTTSAAATSPPTPATAATPAVSATAAAAVAAATAATPCSTPPDAHTPAAATASPPAASASAAGVSAPPPAAAASAAAAAAAAAATAPAVPVEEFDEDAFQHQDLELVAFAGDSGKEIESPSAPASIAAPSVEGDHFYCLSHKDLEVIDSDDEGADDEDESVPAPTCLPDRGGAALGHGAVFLQGCAEDVNVSRMLSSAAAIDAVLGGGAIHAPDSPEAKLLLEKVEEDLMMVQLFLARLNTPALLSWAARDGVLLRDISLAASRVRYSFLCALIDLDGGGRGVGV